MKRRDETRRDVNGKTVSSHGGGQGCLQFVDFFCTLLVVWLPVFCSTVGGWECFCVWVGVQVPGRL